MPLRTRAAPSPADRRCGAWCGVRARAGGAPRPRCPGPGRRRRSGSGPRTWRRTRPPACRRAAPASPASPLRPHDDEAVDGLVRDADARRCPSSPLPDCARQQSDRVVLRRGGLEHGLDGECLTGAPEPGAITPMVPNVPLRSAGRPGSVSTRAGPSRARRVTRARFDRFGAGRDARHRLGDTPARRATSLDRRTRSAAAGRVVVVMAEIVVVAAMVTSPFPTWAVRTGT